MKFAASSSQLESDPAEVLEERRKKFAKNIENLVSLDEEIAKNKTKHIRKSKDRKFRQKDHKDRKFRDNKRKHSGEKLGQKSRTEIFGKKKFIKRIKRNNGKPNIKTE